MWVEGERESSLAHLLSNRFKNVVQCKKLHLILFCKYFSGIKKEEACANDMTQAPVYCFSMFICSIERFWILRPTD